VRFASLAVTALVTGLNDDVAVVAA